MTTLAKKVFIHIIIRFVLIFLCISLGVILSDNSRALWSVWDYVIFYFSFTSFFFLGYFLFRSYYQDSHDLKHFILQWSRLTIIVGIMGWFLYVYHIHGTYSEIKKHEKYIKENCPYKIIETDHGKRIQFDRGDETSLRCINAPEEISILRTWSLPRFLFGKSQVQVFKIIYSRFFIFLALFYLLPILF